MNQVPYVTYNVYHKYPNLGWAHSCISIPVRLDAPQSRHDLAIKMAFRHHDKLRNRDEYFKDMPRHIKKCTFIEEIIEEKK